MASGGGDRYVMNHRGIRTVMDFWPEIDDQQAGIPTLNGEVWILGKRYASPKGNNILVLIDHSISLKTAETKYLVEDVRSKLWFTYRRNFRPIGKKDIDK
jgi:two-component SAPR family response regulator